MLAGARSFTAVGEWVADAPPQVLAALGVRRDPLTRRFEPPGEATIRRVLEAADAGALDAAVGSWLDARLRAASQAAGHDQRPRRAVAVDGKAVRGTRHASSGGQPVHLLAALDQHAGAVLGQAAVDGKTNEITHFAPLLEPLDLAGCVITADALHTQREHAQFLVAHKKAHYILVVKKNQPGLYAQVKNLPWRHIPVAARQRNRGHGRQEHRTLKTAAVAAGLGLPARRPGHLPHPPDPAAGRREVADRHRLRHHQPGRPPGNPGPARRLDPRPLADRGAAPHPRRQLRRRRLPDPHRQRTPGHGHPAQPRHRDLENGRARQHRRRLQAPRPGRHPHPRNPRTQSQDE